MKNKISLSRNVEELESPIRDVVARAERVAKKGEKDIIYLNIGDPLIHDFDTPDYMKEAYADAVKNVKASYAPSLGDHELRGLLAKKENVPKEDIIVTAGCSEGVFYLVTSMLNPGENLLTASPSYSQYISICQLLGGKNKFYNCVDEWQPDADDLRKKIDEKSRGIVLVNPNNPTGAVYDEKRLKEIADLAGEYNLPIICDQIYDKITYGKEAVHFSKLAKDVPHAILNGFSKVHLCPGYRVGYIAFHNMDEIKEGVAKICRLRLAMTTHTQKAVIPAVEREPVHIREMVSKLRERRDLVHSRLNEIEGMHCTKPEGTFYAFPGVEGGWKSDKEFSYDLFDETGVLTVFGEGFSHTLKHKHFRIVFLAPENVLNDAMDRIEGFMKKRTN